MFTGTLQQLDQLVSHLQNPYLYVITTTHVKGQWFFFDIEDLPKKPFRVMWVPNITPAFKFISEEAVEEFRSEYFSPRKTNIIRLEA